MTAIRSASRVRPNLTLALLAIAHAFNHAQVALLPLVYLAVIPEFHIGVVDVAVLVALSSLLSGFTQLTYGLLTRYVPRRVILGLGSASTVDRLVIDWPSGHRQVLTNLLSNAIKFTRHADTPAIEVAGWIEAGQPIYCVKDNGAGFDMQYVGKLFGLFHRLHGVEKFEGIGLGLATAQRIVHRHGGKIWAEGEVDNGARFYFSLPEPTK